MKKIVFVVFTIVAALLFGSWALSSDPLPPLKDGDLVFHTSKSSQSAAIFAATAHPFTHMGIVKIVNGQALVVEAGGKVGETTLAKWIGRGVLQRVAIYRHRSVNPQNARRILAAAVGYYGKPYDIFFSFDNDAIYCSELPFYAYRAVGIEIGQVEKISELNVNNVLAQKLMESRWEKHPICRDNGYDFDECRARIYNQRLITPASIAGDGNFRKIYSNYPL